MRISFYQFVFTFFIFLFSFNHSFIVAQDNIGNIGYDDISDIIDKEYSYESVLGLDLEISPTDFLIINIPS